MSAVLDDALTLGDQIARELGADRVRAPNEIERNAVETIVEPCSAEEIAAVVRKCEADRITIAPIGAARTLSQIRRTPVRLGISLRRMARIIAYEPDDMTVVVEAGLTVGDLNATLAARGQQLPIDPRDPGATTIGSLIATAHTGPLRLSEGTVRDLLIGIQFAGHGGHLVRGGGRVVKNVAGYDLMKVMTGSFGTLGIVTQAVFKVRPIAENYAIAIESFIDRGAAFEAASALNDQLALIHLEVLSHGACAAIGRADRFSLLAGYGGIASELTYQCDRIADILSAATEVIEGDRALDLYAALRDFDCGNDALAARMAVLPAQLSRCVGDSTAEFVAHAGCGVAEIWTRADQLDLAGRWRELARSARGHLRILSAPASLRSQLEFFDRPNAGAFKLMQRLKTAFDPVGIFNPNCFVGAL